MRNSTQKAVGSLQNQITSWRLSAAYCLLLTASGSTIAYLFFLALPYPLLPLYNIPLLDLGKIANFDHTRAAAFVGGYALIFGFYLVAARAASQLNDARYLWLIVGAALGFALILIWVYPIGAIDIYDYIFRARLWSIYDYNPLTVAPLHVNHDLWYPYVVWVWFPSPYGPLWTIISFALVKIGGHDLLGNLMLFKLLPTICIGVCSLLIYDLLKPRPGGEALRGVLLFAWNPLLLFESAVNGHNDLVMMTFVLLGLWLYGRRHLHGAVICCLLAAFIKIAALVTLPMVLMAGLKSQPPPRPSPTKSAGEGDISSRPPETGEGLEVGARLRFLTTSLAACVLIAVALYAPFWRGMETLAGITALDNRFTSSLAAIFKLSVETFAGTATAEAWGRNVFSAVFLLVYGYQLLKTPTAARALQQHVFDLLAVFLLIATLWFQPWYVVWLIALAPLADARNQRLALLWSASAISVYLIFDFVWVWYAEFLNAYNELVVNMVVVLAWLGPLLVAEVLRQRRKQKLPDRKMGAVEAQVLVETRAKE